MTQNHIYHCITSHFLLMTLFILETEDKLEFCSFLLDIKSKLLSSSWSLSSESLLHDVPYIFYRRQIWAAGNQAHTLCRMHKDRPGFVLHELLRKRCHREGNSICLCKDPVQTFVDGTFTHVQATGGLTDAGFCTYHWYIWMVTGNSMCVTHKTRWNGLSWPQPYGLSEMSLSY